MTSPRVPYYIICEDMNGKPMRVVNDENGRAFKDKEAAEFYAKDKGIEKYEIIDAETYMKKAQAVIARRRQ